MLLRTLTFVMLVISVITVLSVSPVLLRTLTLVRTALSVITVLSVRPVLSVITVPLARLVLSMRVCYSYEASAVFEACATWYDNL